MPTAPYLAFQHKFPWQWLFLSQKEEDTCVTGAGTATGKRALVIHTSFVLGKITCSSKKVVRLFTSFSLCQWWHNSTLLVMGRALGTSGKGMIFLQEPPRASQVLFAQDTLLAPGYSHTSVTFRKLRQASSGKNPEKQPLFKMTLPSGSLQDYRFLMMRGVGLHPSHFCSQEGTKCPTCLPRQCKLKHRCVRPRHLFL